MDEVMDLLPGSVVVNIDGEIRYVNPNFPEKAVADSVTD